ncbi:MAG TPA: hypothetical protein VGQ20_06475 [Acidimicrobiales bacterium]|jgi:hypothetical protein|nr:hypothetical protein [Acidimicrobiales bacterium]
MFKIRRTASLTAVAVLGFAGAAAAATGAHPLTPLLSEGAPAATTTTSSTTTVPSTTTTAGSVTTTTGQSSAAALASTDVVCPEGAVNHGAAVSEVAKDKSTTGAEHGQAVSAMAQSDCGKQADLEEDESPTTTTPQEVECPADVRNHGAAVSQVAKDKSTTGAEHGQAVSAMAQSDCGK